MLRLACLLSAFSKWLLKEIINKTFTYTKYSHIHVIFENLTHTFDIRKFEITAKRKIMKEPYSNKFFSFRKGKIR